MHEYILKFNSYTTAMNAQKVLTRSGIKAQVKKTTSSYEGCVYFIAVSDIEGAGKILSENDIHYTADSEGNGAQ